MAGRQGFEPRYADPESAVLPLDDLPAPDALRVHLRLAPAHAEFAEGQPVKLLSEPQALRINGVYSLLSSGSCSLTLLWLDQAATIKLTGWETLSTVLPTLSGKLQDQ